MKYLSAYSPIPSVEVGFLPHVYCIWHGFCLFGTSTVSHREAILIGSKGKDCLVFICVFLRFNYFGITFHLYGFFSLY